MPSSPQVPKTGLLKRRGGNLFDRCATFEGWEGLEISLWVESSAFAARLHSHLEMCRTELNYEVCLGMLGSVWLSGVFLLHEWLLLDLASESSRLKRSLNPIQPRFMFG